jgi:hypothetical protein
MVDIVIADRIAATLDRAWGGAFINIGTNQAATYPFTSGAVAHVHGHAGLGITTLTSELAPSTWSSFAATAVAVGDVGGVEHQ